MSQIVINNGDSGLVVRNALNSMFTELYASVVVPIKIPGVSTNRIQVIPANTFLEDIAVSATAGTPILRIGTTPNGTELMDDTPVGNSEILTAQLYCLNATNIYFTVSGGTISIRMDVQYGYY